MSDIPVDYVHRVPQPVTDAVRFRVGHYAAAVAHALLRAQVPVHTLHASGPITQSINIGEPEEFVDAHAALYFGQAVAAALRNADTALEWTAQSGWLLHPHLDVEFEDGVEPDHFLGARWMGQDLVPAPAQVLGFVQAGREDWDAAGSAQRPYYRTATAGYGQLLDQLGAYLPDPASDRFGYEDWSARFEQDRDNVSFWNTVDELTTSEPDPVLDVPLRRSEARALLRLLDLLQAYALGSSQDLAAAAAADLTARLDGGSEATETHRTARDLALRAQGWRREPLDLPPRPGTNSWPRTS